MTAKVPDPRLLQSRAVDLRAEATRQRTLMAERLESEWDDASFVKVTELKSGIAQEEQFTTINRQRADEKATRVAELRAEQERLTKSGDTRGAEEVGEAAGVGEHQVATLRKMAVEADQRLAAKRVELAEFEQARTTNSRPSDDQFRDAEKQFDLMEDQARDLEFAARRAQAAVAIDNVDEKATAELDAEQAFARARAATFDPAKIAAVTASDVTVDSELPTIDTSWADALETSDPSTDALSTATDALGLDPAAVGADSAMDPSSDMNPLTEGLDADAPAVSETIDDGRVDAPIESDGLVDPGLASTPEPEFAVVDDTSGVSGDGLAPIDDLGESFADDGEGFSEF